MIFRGILFAFLYVAAAVGLSALAYKCGLAKTYTRKIVHVAAGGEYFILSYFFGTSYIFAVVAAGFTLLLFLAYLFRALPMVSSDGDNDPGTVYYGVAMTLLAVGQIFLPELALPFGIGVLCTSVGDGAAGIAGGLIKRKNPVLYGKKTLFGTLAMILFSFASVLIFDAVYETDLGVFYAFLVAVFAAGIELLSSRGLDNLFVPLLSSAFGYLLLTHSVIVDYLSPIVFTPFVFALAKEKRALTTGGLFAAFALDVIVSAALGNFGFLLLLTFLVGGVLTDKVKPHAVFDLEEKTGARDAAQVVANGGIAALSGIFFLVTSRGMFAVAAAASLAEALADTAASGIGSRAKRVVDLRRLKLCAAGESGGISALGTLSALVAAGIVGGVTAAFLPSWKVFLLVTLSGFVGCLVDSVLGAFVQARYRCTVCDKITEKHVHHGAPTVPARGLPFFDNDATNLVSTAVAALLAALLCGIFSL